jgi:hypothetical protein
MRRLVLCLLLLVSPTLAHASGVHSSLSHPRARFGLVTDTFKVDPSWQPAQPSAPLQLSAPCLACRVGTFVSATGAATSPKVPATKGPIGAAPTPSATSRSPVARSSPARAPAKRVIAIGDSWRLAHGREFSIRLTPTQEECAPLVRLKF